MAYGCYSEIYIAINVEDKTFIKIGETTNARRRNRQLKEDGFKVYESIEVGHGESCRLFIESYLRIKLESLNIKRIKRDYFYCKHNTISDFVLNNFEVWVDDALNNFNLITKNY